MADTYVEVVCKCCGGKFSRRLKEVTRSKKVGRDMFCNQSCATSHRNKYMPYAIVNLGNLTARVTDEFSIFRKFARSASLRTKGTNLTPEYLKEVWDSQEGICPLTGEEMVVRGWHKINYGGAVPLQASLDRVDSKVGYYVGNVRFVSLIANFAKSSWNDEDVIEFCQKVAARHNKELS